MGIIVVPKLVAGTIIGTNLFCLTTGNSKLHVVDISVPSALVETTFYGLNGGTFAVNQKDPAAIVSNPGTNRLYVTNVSEGAPANMIFAVYDATAPLAVTQQGTINFGANPFIAGNGGIDLAINFPIVYSLLGGDVTATPAQLNAINVSNPAAPVVVGSAVLIGTFSDKPRKMYLDTVNSRLYVFSGTVSTPNQKVFVYDVSNQAVAPVLVTTLAIGATDAQAGLRSGFVSNGTISMMAGTGTVGNVNLVLYDTSGMFVGSANVTSGVAGTAIAQAA